MGQITIRSAGDLPTDPQMIRAEWADDMDRARSALWTCGCKWTSPILLHQIAHLSDPSRWRGMDPLHFFFLVDQIGIGVGRYKRSQVCLYPPVHRGEWGIGSGPPGKLSGRPARTLHVKGALSTFFQIISNSLTGAFDIMIKHKMSMLIASTFGPVLLSGYHDNKGSYLLQLRGGVWPVFLLSLESAVVSRGGHPHWVAARYSPEWFTHPTCI